MKLSDTLKDNTIVYPLRSKTKSDAIQELLNCLLKQNFLTDTTKLFSFIDNHDKLLNPAVGRGIAYHYSSSTEIMTPIAALGISNEGIDYGSPDKQKVYFIFLTLDAMNEPIQHRKLITRFQHFINDNKIKSSILSSKSSDNIMKIIFNWENNYLKNEKI